jgi:hypothetical protein
MTEQPLVPEICGNSLMLAAAAIELAAKGQLPCGVWGRTRDLQEGDPIRLTYRDGTVLTGTFTNPTGTIEPFGPRVKLHCEDGNVWYQCINALSDPFVTWEKIGNSPTS